MYSDIFRFDAEEYWRNEGNNKRMQKYHKFNEYLKEITLLFSWLIFCYFLTLASMTIGNLTNSNIGSILVGDIFQKYLCIYFCSFIISCWLTKLKIITREGRKDFLKKVIIAMPLIYLVGINILYFNSLFITLIILFVYLGITYINGILIERLDKIYEYATEEPAREILDGEVNEVVVNENKKKKERKRK